MPNEMNHAEVERRLKLLRTQYGKDDNHETD